MAQPHQNTQNLGASGLYGTYTNYGGGGVPVARNELDELRIGIGRAPQAEYPDGYLGTIRTRRDDRGRPNGASENVLDSLKVRIGQRSYQRGVHKGERIDQQGYYYPAGLEPHSGIMRQMNAVKEGNVYRSTRHVFMADIAPAPHLPNDGKAGPTVKSDSPMYVNNARQDQMARMRPQWK
jgi:hypothetical protein